MFSSGLFKMYEYRIIIFRYSISRPFYGPISLSAILIKDRWIIHDSFKVNENADLFR